MLVRRLKMFPIELTVRGYITETAWAEYSTSKTVNSMPLPAGLQYGQKLRPRCGPQALRLRLGMRMRISQKNKPIKL